MFQYNIEFTFLNVQYICDGANNKENLFVYKINSNNSEILFKTINKDFLQKEYKKDDAFLNKIIDLYSVLEQL